MSIQPFNRETIFSIVCFVRILYGSKLKVIMHGWDLGIGQSLPEVGSSSSEIGSSSSYIWSSSTYIESSSSEIGSSSSEIGSSLSEIESIQR